MWSPHLTLTGWWFGTLFIFPYKIGMSSSQLTFIFFRFQGLFRWALRLALVKAARNDHEEWATQGVGIDLAEIHKRFREALETRHDPTAGGIHMKHDLTASAKVTQLRFPLIFLLQFSLH